MTYATHGDAIVEKTSVEGHRFKVPRQHVMDEVARTGERIVIINAERQRSGSAAVAGLEYQIGVSIWLALDLILASKLTEEMTLEPASQEDLEAELYDYEPGRVTSSTAIDGYTLVVQAKYRSGDAWTVHQIKRLLMHGGKDRMSAACRLSASNIRYLLVTNGGLNGGARKLQVHHAGSWPNSAGMPVSIVESLPPGAPGRVAVIGTQDGERLETHIKQLLTESFRVPNARWKECLKTLHEEALHRILGGGSGRWRRSELEHVIRKHDGYIASSPELEHYVHPTNWNRLRSTMTTRHAALIIGQSGTGKTMATRKLYEELSSDIPGLSRVRITQGATQLTTDQTPRPVLYDVEDPWGRFDFDSRNRPWNDQLAQLFAGATHDRMIVVTSRLDVAESARVLESVKHWRFPLESEHYGKKERRRLYESRIDGLPPDLERVAATAMDEVLAKLGTPLEIQKFFDALRTIDRERLENPSGFVLEAIRQAHHDSIERTVIEQIEERDDVRAAAIVWGLLQANGKLSLRTVMKIEERLADLDEAMIRGVRPLISFFVAGRNLRQNEDVVTYYHPRVDAGIESALLRHENRLVVRRAFHHLIDVLTSLDEPHEWGTATAASILATVSRKADLGLAPSKQSAARVDSWVAARLKERGLDFEMSLRLAGAAGSASSNGAELARYLLNRAQYTTTPGFDWHEQWERPDRDKDWYARMRSDPAIRPLVETFIRDVLPAQRVDFPRSFAVDLERITPDLSGAFIAGARSVVDAGFFHTIQVIIEGAISDLEGYDEVVDCSIDVLTPSKADRTRAEELHLAIVNREYPDDYADHLAEDENERGYAANRFIEAYVDRVRMTIGWRNLIRHRHRREFVFHWLKQLGNESTNGSTDVNEVAAVFKDSYNEQYEHILWSVLLRGWDSRYLNALTKRVRDGHIDREVRSQAMACLVRHAPETLVEIVCDLHTRDDFSSQVEIAVDLGHIRHFPFDEDPFNESAALAVLAMLEAPLAELSDAYLALLNGNTLDLSQQAHELLRCSAPEGSTDVRRMRVSFGASISLEDDVRWILKNADSPGIAVTGLNAAIRLQMKTTVEEALNHKFAAVAARALTVIGESMAAPLPERLLQKVHSRGSPIRKALVALLGSKPHVDHETTLLRLAGDTYSTNAIYQGKGELPIARAAVAVIGESPPTDPQRCEQLAAIAIDTVDPQLRYAIFRLLSTTSDSAYQGQLFDLAVSPGGMDIRRTAARALLVTYEHVAPEILARVTAELLKEQDSEVATCIALLYAVRAEIPHVYQMATILATDLRRRVLLLLFVWALRHRDSATAQNLADMLPRDHPGVALALGAEIEPPDDQQMADLGDPAVCDAVLRYLK